MPAPMDDGSGTTSVSKSVSDNSNVSPGRPTARRWDSASSNDCWADGDNVDASLAQRWSSCARMNETWADVVLASSCARVESIWKPIPIQAMGTGASSGTITIWYG